MITTFVAYTLFTTIVDSNADRVTRYSSTVDGCVRNESHRKILN